MFKTWSASGEDGETLARDLEAHLNEYAEELLGVGYAVGQRHYALAVYRPLGAAEPDEAAAVTVATQIIDRAHAQG